MYRIVVLGGAESGVGAAVLAKKNNIGVFLSDRGSIKEKYKKMLEYYGISHEEGGHSEEIILGAERIIKSPGIPDTAPIIEKCRKKGIPIISEIEFASEYDTAKKICITGSNGKTTTTSLIHHILKESGVNVGLAGNIGTSYALSVATQKFDWHVLEISSFQLDNCHKFKPDVAIITNITPDHLDRYGHSMEKYAAAKFKIAGCMTEDDIFIYDMDDEYSTKHPCAQKIKAKKIAFGIKSEPDSGACFKDGKICLNFMGKAEFRASELKIKGEHNVYNAMAAILAARCTGTEYDRIIRAACSFKPVEHRLEPVAEIEGVSYINDSKATNPDSAKFALRAQKSPVVWIVGGKDKGNDYSDMTGLVKEKVKAMVCLGIDNSKLHSAFENIVGRENMKDCTSAEEAVKTAAAFSSPGDVVLLSPCCASFDLFENYEDRGKQFKDAVLKLQEK